MTQMILLAAALIVTIANLGQSFKADGEDRRWYSVVSVVFFIFAMMIGGK